MPTPSGGPTAPYAASSADTAAAADAGRSRPPHSRGQVGQAQPESARRVRHSSRLRSGSQLATSHSRSSPVMSAVMSFTAENRRPAFHRGADALGPVLGGLQLRLLARLPFDRTAY